MLTAIVNVTEDWGIGLEGHLLVSIPADLKRFKEITTGKTVVLGQVTMGTFPGGKPLKNRRNIILSDDMSFDPQGAEVVRSIQELDRLLGLEQGETVVVGGASVYEQLFDRCSVIYVTRTYGDYPADRFFPNLDKLSNWRTGDVSPVYEYEGVKYRYIDYYNTNI